MNSVVHNVGRIAWGIDSGGGICLSPDDNEKVSRGPIEAHSCPSFVPLSLIEYHFLNAATII